MLIGGRHRPTETLVPPAAVGHGIPGPPRRDHGQPTTSLAFRILHPAYCQLPPALEGGGMERALGRHGIVGQDVTSERERNSEQLKKVNERRGNVSENKRLIFKRQE